ncbi:MAG: hypothetical protein IPH20_16420 [Bacteroidales bacterium]|nr:hypothetical protein [Bacteroidales bacterium]
MEQWCYHPGSCQCAGYTYSVTITDANGCTATSSATVNNIGGPAASISAQTNVAKGAFTGSATVLATGGTSPFTYLWDDPSAQTPATAIGLAAGTYTVTITDANGCTATAQAIITQPTALSGGAVATSSTCGNANGSVDLSVSGGTPAYTYAWSNGATTQDLVNVVANTYSVTITDANGCTATSSATVNNIGGPAASISAQTNVACNGAFTGSATVLATGGTSPFTYLWNDPSAQTLATATGLAAGTYTVTVTDFNGCTATAQAIITQPTALSGGAVATSSTCGNANGSVDLSVSGGTPAYTYAWSNGATTQDLVNVVANTYSGNDHRCQRMYSNCFSNRKQHRRACSFHFCTDQCSL